VYCVQWPQRFAGRRGAFLRQAGLSAFHLEGGLEAWRAHGGAVARYAAPTRWVTRARPKIDRIACPWLVRRFIDPAAEFFYVPSAVSARVRGSQRGTPYDVPRRPVHAQRKPVQLRCVHPHPRTVPTRR
jgi:hypothetical protein